MLPTLPVSPFTFPSLLLQIVVVFCQCDYGNNVPLNRTKVNTRLDTQVSVSTDPPYTVRVIHNVNLTAAPEPVVANGTNLAATTEASVLFDKDKLNFTRKKDDTKKQRPPKCCYKHEKYPFLLVAANQTQADDDTVPQ